MLARPKLLATMVAISSTARVAAGAPCLALRPTDVAADWSYAGADASSFATPEGNVRVWYARSGKHAPPGVEALSPPEAVLAAAAAAETALARYDELGFRRPVSDALGSPCPDNGGDSRFDLYLIDFNAADGTVILESCSDDATTTCSGFMLVENDFAAGGYTSLVEGFRTVVPHELFHLVQSAYSSNGEPWWMEGTAQWATQQVFPELRDLESFLPVFFKNTNRALDFPALGAAAGVSYGAAIWPVFLTQKLDLDVPRGVFEALAAGASSVLAATEPVLATHNTDLARTFAQFARWNIATGSRAGQAGYASAATYPQVALEPLGPELPARVDGKLAGLSARYFESAGGAARSIQVSANAARLDAWFVPLNNGAAELESATPLPYTGAGAGVVVLSGKVTNHRDIAFTLEVTEALPQLDEGSAGADGAPMTNGGAGGEPAFAADDVGAASGGQPEVSAPPYDPTLASPSAGAPPQLEASAAQQSEGCSYNAHSPPTSATFGALLALFAAAIKRASRRRFAFRSLS